jgi:hypothetical protein
MARDFEDLNDLDDLSDDELRGLVREQLDAHNGLDIDDLTVQVKDGTVILGGRVGTDGERQIAEHVVTDVIGAAVQNEILVDPIRRAESPEAIDEHLVDEDRRAGLQLGDRPTSISPEVEEVEPPIDVDLYGTSDVRTAISDGTPWNPPEAPTQEGT